MMISNTTMKRLAATLALAALMAGGATLAEAQQKTDFKVAWSIYVGWMPWGYAADTGIVKKWADKYGITIEVTQFNDYVESMNQYTAGAFDAVTLTNMDGLSIPAAGGVDTTAVIIGDFSNGNDAVILKDKDDAGRYQGPARQSRRIFGVALPAGPSARKRRHERARRQRGQHLRSRHGGRLPDSGRHRDGDVESDGCGNPGAARRAQGVRLRPRSPARSST